MEVESTQMGMFLATVGLVLVSVGATLVSYFLLRSHVDPNVIVYTSHDDHRSSVILLVIENIGAGVAYNVRFSSPRPIPAKAFGIEGPDKNVPSQVMESGPLVRGIPVLAPGEKRIITWGQYGGLMAALSGSTLPITCTFESRKRFPWDPTSHVTDSVLEVASFEGTDASEHVEVRQARSLEDIGKSLNKLARSAGEVAAVAKRPEMEEALARVRERSEQKDG